MRDVFNGEFQRNNINKNSLYFHKDEKGVLMHVCVYVCGKELQYLISLV